MTQTQSEEARPRGRRGGGGNGTIPLAAREEAKPAAGSTHQLGYVRDRLDELKRLCRSKNAAATEFAEAIEATAVRAHVDRAALKTFVTAAAGDKVTQKRDKARQLSLLFDELGV